ncbi:BRI1 kinase inhibitor 1-like [Abrus precatorius]|uniref:BRI1 kinase inhibitor 1-like n=1 Tax=Abrus precatorius TaxID=3816 RepID=A0A8B8JPZ6_ABRPR|nr:BRI1 kinase inhibitor 1-like [Abrus precatorius]
METLQHQKNTENDVEKQQIEGLAQLRQENIQDQATSPTSSSQPSASSSPSHEFSFTISLHPTFPDNSKAPPSLAVDLSPADDIFFHGHLLPLHFLTHLPSSPRSSTNSMDSFTLPIRDLLADQNPIKDSGSGSSSSSNTSNNSIKKDQDNNLVKKVQGKSKLAFSLFGLTKGLKGCQDKEDNKEKHKKKFKFALIHALKKYLRIVQPRIMLFKGKREKIRSRGHSHSYSGNVTPRNYKQELKGWRGQYSAPASMRTSPTNSGLLLAATPLPSASDSTMEELQAAIQAAIAHCKNSIAKEEKLKC